MSAKERRRMETLARVKRGELTVVAAATLEGLSLRQMRRLWKRYRVDGEAGLVHRSRGRPGNRRMDDELRARIVKRHQERYRDFGPTLACEKLAEDGLTVSPDTLVTLLKERGLHTPRRRRKPHRRRRERRACFGEMLQMDGSHHDWFENGRPCCLMVIVDDATNHCIARLFEAETTEAAFETLRRWASTHGLPRAVYVDRHAIYRNEARADQLTQFARAMKQLGVELICAHSPQAKGRVERRHAVFQDRLVKELRLRNIRTIDEANRVLEGVFLPQLNRRLAVTPRVEHDAHRPVTPAELEAALCVQGDRVVSRDGCVRWQNRWLQLSPGQVLPGRAVRIRHHADNRLTAHVGERMLCSTELPARPAPVKPEKVIVNNRRWRPPPTHPWVRLPAV